MSKVIDWGGYVFAIRICSICTRRIFKHMQPPFPLRKGQCEKVRILVLYILSFFEIILTSSPYGNKALVSQCRSLIPDLIQYCWDMSRQTRMHMGFALMLVDHGTDEIFQLEYITPIRSMGMWKSITGRYLLNVVWTWMPRTNYKRTTCTSLRWTDRRNGQVHLIIIPPVYLCFGRHVCRSPGLLTSH